MITFNLFVIKGSHDGRVGYTCHPQIARIRRRGAQRELFEKKARLAAVREKYFEAIELLKGKENIIIIDGNRSPEEIFDEVWETVRPLWGNG